MIRGRIGLVVVTLGVVMLAVVIPAGGRALVGTAVGAQEVTERALLDNARVMVVEYVFPAGFRGEEHTAIADEFAYVLDGEFGVVTKGVGKRVVRRGDIEYAGKGTIHYSVNEAKRPARVLVVLLKER